MKNFLPYVKQKIEKEDIDAVIHALKSEFVTRGPLVQEFEEKIAEYVGALYAVAFSSGSTALWAAYQASSISSLDKVVTTPNTFIATLSGALHYGPRIQLIDIDEDANMDIFLAEKEINAVMSRGRVFVVPVHFAGVPVDMQALEGSIKVPNVVIIEDASHALGSRYKDGSHVGNCAYSDMTVFSFHPAKNMTCGEGGMVTTNDPELYERLRKCRNYGIEKSKENPWYYEAEEISCNFHMTEMQAALGISQLKRLDSFGEKKSKLVARYRELLASFPGLLCMPDSTTAHYHLFQVYIDFELFGISRTAVMSQLSELGIGSQYHYVPLYKHPIVPVKESLPKMEIHFAQALSLPLFSSMHLDDVDRVVAALREVLLIGLP